MEEDAVRNSPSNEMSTLRELESGQRYGVSEDAGSNQSGVPDRYHKIGRSFVAVTLVFRSGVWYSLVRLTSACCGTKDR